MFKFHNLTIQSSDIFIHKFGNSIQLDIRLNFNPSQYQFALIPSDINYSSKKITKTQTIEFKANGFSEIGAILYLKIYHSVTLFARFLIKDRSRPNLRKYSRYYTHTLHKRYELLNCHQYRMVGFVFSQI